MSNPLEEVPLHLWAEEIVAKLDALGHKCGIVVAIVDMDSGNVTSTGNMEEDDTTGFLTFLAMQHLRGDYTTGENAPERLQ